MTPAAQIIMAIVRGSSRFLTRSGGLGRVIRWGSQGGKRVVGKTKNKAKVAGRVSKTKSGKDVVINPEGGHTFLGKGDASRLLKGARNVSVGRKVFITGSAATGGYALGSASKGTKKSTPEKTYTETDPGGMKFSAAPAFKHPEFGHLAKPKKSSAPAKKSPKKQPSAKKSSGKFSQAFKEAYAKGKGKGKVFPWKGKSYIALTKEDTGGLTIAQYNRREKKLKKLKKHMPSIFKG